MTFGKSIYCCHQPRAAVSNHWTPLAITPQPRGGLDHPEGLNDPLSHQLQWTSAEPGATTQTQRYSICNHPHPKNEGIHLRYFYPPTETRQQGTNPINQTLSKCHPRTNQGHRQHLLR